MLNPKIIEARKKGAPILHEIIETSKACVSALDALENASGSIEAPKQHLLEAISGGREKLLQISRRAELRYQRFNSGLVTVAIGGIEKSGKTTLLKTLTGIEDLPTANERCTAVCCEIIYDPARSEFDLEFHSDEEFCEGILKPLIQRFNKCLPEDQSSDKIERLPVRLDEFDRMVLPSLGRFQAGIDVERHLSDLIVFKSNLAEIRKFAGQPPKLGEALLHLRQWVANSKDPIAKARIATVARCSIRTQFKGGSENLRWVDTPGVDDPNPLARERTLRTIGKDADLLVVATMPRDTPDATKSFVDFWTSIHNLPDEIGIMDRLLILLNWKRDSDPNRENLDKHWTYLKDLNKVPASLFCGPLEATKSEDVAAFMEKVNTHLSTNLAAQDARVIDRIANDLKSALAEIRTSVFDKARRLSPSDPSKADAETSLFLEWFNRTSKSGQEEGFWPRLRELFVAAVESVPRSEQVSKAQAELDALFNQKSAAIGDILPTEADMRQMRQTGGGVPPITAYMQHFAMSSYSDLINSLAHQVQDFGPIMQNSILELFKQAGLGPMLSDGDATKVLQELTRTIDQVRWKAENENPVLNAFVELTNLQQSLHYVYRWEMRPAINFLSPLHWAKGRADEDLALLLDQAGETARAKELRDMQIRIPGVQDTDEQHALVFKDICKFALLGIRAVLSGSRCRLSNIADDFVRDFQTRLTFGNATQTYWRDLLAPSRGELLGEEITAIRANSEKIQRFTIAVDELGNCLP